MESIGEAFYALDGDLRYVYVNGVAERLWGKRRVDVIGRRVPDVFPSWEGSMSAEAHLRVLKTGKAETIHTVSSVLGVPIDQTIVPRGDGLAVYFRDVSAHTRLEQDLRARDEVLRLAERSAGIGIWDMDMAMRTVRATPQFFSIVGLPPTNEAISIDALRALRHPDDRVEVVNNFQRALNNGEDQYEAEYRILRPDGEVRWIFGRGRVFRDKDGTPVRYSGVDLDITERKKAEEHLALTTKELSHRTKNILAVVQSMVRQIGQRTRDFDQFEKRLFGCLAALSHSHDVLVASDWKGADLRDLIAQQLAPFGGLDDHRFIVEGGVLSLTPQTAPLVGLAFHELATNAVKHGALKVPNGVVCISWQPEDDAVRLTWQEQNGPRVTPPTAKGFGHVVLQRMATTLDSQVSLQFPSEGAQWSMRLDRKHMSANRRGENSTRSLEEGG